MPAATGGHTARRIIGRAQDAIRAHSDLGRAVTGIQLYGRARKQAVCPGIVGAVRVDVHIDQVAQLPAVEAEVHGAVALRVRRFARFGIGRPASVSSVGSLVPAARKSLPLKTT